MDDLIIHHFDGKSLRRRSDAWLMSAIADAHLKVRGCDDSPAHAAMWQSLAEEYCGEQVRRDLSAVK
jgi:hypothetical protein